MHARFRNNYCSVFLHGGQKRVIICPIRGFFMQNELLQELEARGFINQTSNIDGLNDALNSGKITAYLGSDPTADSLHVGHLVPVMMMHLRQLRSC